MPPDFVAFWRTSASRPPILTVMPSHESPLSGLSFMSSSRPVFILSSESDLRYSSSGCPLMYTPVTSFSMESSIRSGYSGTFGRGGGASSSISPKSDTCPAMFCRRDRPAPSSARSYTAITCARRAPVWSNAPALTRLSTTRLFTWSVSTRRQKS